MTTEELAAAGLPAEPVVEGPENAPPPEEGALPSPAAPGVTRMVRSEQMTKTLEMWMLASEIWSGQGQRDLCLLLSFSENRSLLPT
jgi:hypothetical protein